MPPHKGREIGRPAPPETGQGLLERLKVSPSNKTLILATIILFVPFILLTLFFCINEYELETSTGYGVLDFELAWTSEGFNEISAAWGPANRQHQIFVHYVDYLYIIFYGLFAAGCILVASRRLKGKLQEVGLFVTLAPLVSR